jgi:glycerol-3-phosphate acyltransferase PlsY
VVWLITRKLTGTASLGSIIIAIGMPISIALEGSPAWEVAATVGLALLVMLRHTDNIKRLVRGRELSANREPTKSR